jgi:uncharacterized protein (TIGR02246 family)
MRLTLIAMAVLLLAECRPACSQDSQAGAEIRGVLATQEAAWNRSDVAAFMEGYEKSADLTFSGAGGVTRGWQNVLDRYRQRYPGAAAMGQLRFSDIEVRIIGSEAALVLGQFHLTRTEKAGGDASGHFSLVFRKTPSGWRIIHDHTS